MPNYHELIDNIVSRRNSVASGFDDKIAVVKSWKKYVSEMLNFFENRRQVWNQVLSDSNSIEEGMKIETELRSLLDEINQLLGEREDGKSLIAASSRANRNYVNLGIIGPWRIGKSQITQKLTGLDTWLIPTGAGTNCTACPINIINDNYNGHSNVAVLTLYSVQQMCNNINQYIDRCGMKSVISEMTAETQTEFLSQCQERLSQLPAQEPSDTEKKGLYDKMKRYFEKASEYYRFLSNDKKEIYEIQTDTSKREYRPFVSYFATPGGAQETYQCLATRNADLYVNFHFLDGDNIGKLRILDTPGIGESKLNVTEGLSHALRYDLDIAVAAAQARPQIDDEKQIRDFHKILKEETHSRHPENWVYYLFNVYSTTPNMSSSILKQKHKLVKSDLEDNIVGANGIFLKKSHFKDIDCLVNQGIDCPDEDNIDLSKCRNEEETLGTYFDSILSEMVDAIATVDNVFYTAAETYFTEVKTKFYQVLSLVKTLSIINYNNQTIARIDRQMSDLCSAIGNINSSLHLYEDYEVNDPNHQKSLTKKIKEYCDEADYGKTLLSILGKKGSANDFNSLFNLIEDVLRTKITVSNWRENYDFDGYIRLKRELIERIEKDVLSKYDKITADRNLESEKKKIFDAYKTVGRLSDIVQDKSDKWYESFIKLLEESGQYPDLLKTFKDFVDYELNVESQLKNTVESLKAKNQHRDQFIYDEDDYMPFDDYKKAIKAFAFSLFNIEIGIKQALFGNGESSYESMIRTQEDAFLEAVSPINNIPFANGYGYTATGTQLRMLYQEHSEVFNDDETAKKNGVAEEWRRIRRFENN